QRFPAVITVRIDGQSKRFEWQNVANPSYFPRVWTVNLDEEPDEEAVNVLTAGLGREQVHDDRPSSGHRNRRFISSLHLHLVYLGVTIMSKRSRGLKQLMKEFG